MGWPTSRAPWTRTVVGDGLREWGCWVEGGKGGKIRMTVIA